MTTTRICRAIAVASSLLALTGWRAGEPPPASTPAVASSECAGHGTGRVYGRFHFPDLSTPVMVVYLVRDVPYTDWYLQSRVYDTSVRNQKRDLHVTQFDPAAKACLQITTADASGSFAFSFIAPGRYYILTNVEYRNAGSVTSQPVAFARPDGEVTAIVGGASSFTEHAMQMEYSRVFEVGAGDEFHMNDSADGWTRVECGRLPEDTCPGDTSSNPLHRI